MRNSGLRRLLFAGISVLTLATIGVAVAVGATSRDAARSINFSSAQAVAQVTAFVGDPTMTAGLVVRPPVDGAVNTFYLISNKALTAAVDVHDGRVISALYHERIPTSSSITIDQAAAQAAAQAFLDAHGVPADGLDTSVRQLSHGQTNEYVVAWERVVDGIIVPDSRTIGVDAATGLVFRYLDIRRPYKTPPSPIVSRDAAIGSAGQISGLADPTLEAAELRIDFDQAGNQLLIWRIYLGGSLPASDSSQAIPIHDVVDVDAISGAATLVAQG